MCIRDSARAWRGQPQEWQRPLQVAQRRSISWLCDPCQTPKTTPSQMNIAIPPTWFQGPLTIPWAYVALSPQYCPIDEHRVAPCERGTPVYNARRTTLQSGNPPMLRLSLPLLVILALSLIH